MRARPPWGEPAVDHGEGSVGHARSSQTATLWSSSGHFERDRRNVKTHINQVVRFYFPMKNQALSCIALLLLFCDAGWPSTQPPAPSPRFLAGIEYDYGNRYAADGDYEQAIRYYRRALAIFPSPAVFNSLGIVCMETGDHAQAIDAFRHAIRLRPAEAEYHYNLGFAYEAADRLEQAAPAYRQSLALDPQQAAVHQALGEVLHELGLDHEATSGPGVTLATHC